MLFIVRNLSVWASTNWFRSMKPLFRWLTCGLHDFIQIILEVPSCSSTVLVHMCFLCACSFVTWSLHAVYCQKPSLFFPSILCLPVCMYVCLMCLSCIVWCVSVAFDKGTGWIVSKLKPSTWPQRSTGNLNASFPFLLWKYLPLAGKNTFTSCFFITSGLRGYPPSTGFPSFHLSSSFSL